MTYFAYDDEANAINIEMDSMGSEVGRVETKTIYDKECMINLDFKDGRLSSIEILLGVRND